MFAYYRLHRARFLEALSNLPFWHPPRGFRVPEELRIRRPREQPSADALATPAEKNVLKITSWDLRIPENAETHHTADYELVTPDEEWDDNGKPVTPTLVVRRSQDIDIELSFDRPYDRKTDKLRLILELDVRHTRERDGSRLGFPVTEEKPDDSDTAWLADVKDTTAKLKFRAPASSIIGRWNIIVEVHFKPNDDVDKFSKNIGKMYVLFNPWSKDDPVYMDDDVALKEYVLNDNGLIYYGNHRMVRPRAWNFGQFEDFILPGLVELMDRMEIRLADRRSPVRLSRALAAAVNSSDDSGILTGRWDGKYSDGTSPLRWKGSVAILQQFFSDWKPVKYGQCWVFSGLLTTVCRAFGIPIRSVTNFKSAHDTDGTMTIDRIIELGGGTFKEDSIWNFHVWNEAWMARPDLKDGCGGWQVIDATPQELSDGIYTCGPCPVSAVRSGDVLQGYDGPFIFAEVNADVVEWQETSNGHEITRIKTNSVGVKISTKTPLIKDRLDLTDTYKYTEGSDEERAAVFRAISSGNMPRALYDKLYNDKPNDMSVEVEDNDLWMGQDAKINLTLRNSGDTAYNVEFGIIVSVMYYTGEVLDAVHKQEYDLQIKPKSDEKFSLTVPEEKYLPKLVDMCFLRIRCFGRVIQTSQVFVDEETVTLQKPSIVVNAPESVPLMKRFDVDVSFTNPLSTPLTKCLFTIESPGLQKPTTQRHRAIGPGQTVDLEFRLQARKAGEREVIVSLDSREISDVFGTATIIVDRPSAGSLRPRSRAN